MSVSGVNSNYAGLVNTASNTQTQLLESLLASTDSQSSLLDALSTNGSDSSASSDILDLSTQGQDAADQLYQLLEASAQASMQNTAESASVSLAKKLTAALSQNGIDTSQEIDLQLDSNGKVTVSNDNSQGQQIEDVINNDPQLKQAVTGYLEFMQAIGPTMENGSGSGAGLSNLAASLSSLESSSGSQGTVTLAVQGNGFQTSYEDASGNTTVLAAS